MLNVTFENCKTRPFFINRHKKIKPALQTRENLPVVLRVTYPENQVALIKC